MRVVFLLFAVLSLAMGGMATPSNDTLPPPGQFDCLCSVAVGDFRLIDSVTDEEVLTLKDGMTIDVASTNLLSNGKLNVRVLIHPDDAAAEDVRVRTVHIVDGDEEVVDTHTERYPTYALQYNSVDGTDYFDWEPETASGRNTYRFEAQGVLDANGDQATEWASVTVTFCENCYSRVSGWRVIDVQGRREADSAVNPPSPFVVDLASDAYSSQQVNVRAIMDVEGASAPGPDITSVVFELDGVFLRQEFNDQPCCYSAFGDSFGRIYFPWTPTLDQDYEFCATAYHAGPTQPPGMSQDINPVLLPGPTDCVTIRFCSSCSEGPDSFIMVDPKRVRPGDELLEIGNGAEVDWGAFSTSQGSPVNVRCRMLPNDEAWDHVDLYVDQAHVRREFVPPYALFGDSPPYHYFDSYRPLLNSDRVVMRIGCEGVKEDGSRSVRKDVTVTLCKNDGCSAHALRPQSVPAASLVSNSGTEADSQESSAQSPSSRGQSGGGRSKWSTVEAATVGGAGVAFVAIVTIAAVLMRRRRRRTGRIPVTGSTAPGPPPAPAPTRNRVRSFGRRQSLSISKVDLAELSGAEDEAHGAGRFGTDNV